MHTQSPQFSQKRPLQTVQSLYIPEALPEIQTLVEITGLSESSFRRKVEDGKFSAPVEDGIHCTRWVAGQVSNWLCIRVASV